MIHLSSDSLMYCVIYTYLTCCSLPSLTSDDYRSSIYCVAGHHLVLGFSILIVYKVLGPPQLADGLVGDQKVHLSSAILMIHQRHLSPVNTVTGFCIGRHREQGTAPVLLTKSLWCTGMRE